MTTTSPPPTDGVHLLRFDRYDRLLHGLLMVCFLGLAMTGLPLLFSDRPWAGAMARLLGGYGVTGTLHRLFGALLILCFGLHLAPVIHRLLVRRERGILWGPTSLVPQPQDVVQMFQHFRWFFGLGPRPRFDRYTYWEKFDYLAVFWGMAIIGTSGLMLSFPRAFSSFLPGRALNVAHVVHGEEALLAMVFIFTVHFFNSHLRPEKFPMDVVMFTGRVTLDEVRHERPAEYERLVREGGLEALRVAPPSRRALAWSRAAGAAAVAIGLVMVVLTLRALLQ